MAVVYNGIFSLVYLTLTRVVSISLLHKQESLSNFLKVGSTQYAGFIIHKTVHPVYD